MSEEEEEDFDEQVESDCESAVRCGYDLQLAVRAQQELITVKELSEAQVDSVLEDEVNNRTAQVFMGWLVIAIYIAVFIGLIFSEGSVLFGLSGVLFYLGRNNAKAIERYFKKLIAGGSLSVMSNAFPSLGVILLLGIAYRFAAKHFDAISSLERDFSPILMLLLFIVGSVCAIGIPVWMGVYTTYSIPKYEKTKSDNGDIVLKRKA